MDQIEDLDLAKRIPTGDRDAFNDFVILYQGRVYYTALRILGQHEDAFNASQETFLKVWQHIQPLKKGVKVYAWLY